MWHVLQWEKVYYADFVEFFASSYLQGESTFIIMDLSQFRRAKRSQVREEIIFFLELSSYSTCMIYDCLSWHITDYIVPKPAFIFWLIRKEPNLLGTPTTWQRVPQSGLQWPDFLCQPFQGEGAHRPDRKQRETCFTCARAPSLDKELC